jgi:plastocyanin
MPTTSTSRSGSSCSARPSRLGLAALALLSVAALVAARGAAAQTGAVVGRLRLVERAGGAARDLAQGVVWLEAPRRLVSAASAASAPAEETIVMKSREFLPHVRVVRVGGSVGFPNDDPFSHNVFSNTTLGAFDLGLYREGVTRAAQFARPGVYPIYCNIHHRMVSFVVAVPTPWAAQPADDGRFALRDVPPGQYVLHAWHERGGQVRQPVEVRADGTVSVELSLDARGYVSSVHLNKFGLPYGATRADRY